MWLCGYKCVSLNYISYKGSGQWLIRLCTFSLSLFIALLPLGGSNAIRRNKGSCYGQQAAVHGDRSSDAHFTAGCLDVFGSKPILTIHRIHKLPRDTRGHPCSQRYFHLVSFLKLASGYENMNDQLF